jgi:hypothetical protein
MESFSRITGYHVGIAGLAAFAELSFVVHDGVDTSK